MIYKLQCQKKGREKKLPEIITKTSDDDSYVINLKKQQWVDVSKKNQRGNARIHAKKTSGLVRKRTQW